MSLSALLAAPVFAGGRLALSIRWLLAADGLFVAPTFLLPALLTASTSSRGSDVTYIFALVGWSAIFGQASA